MNFDDTPQEAEFRAIARKWVDANAPKQFEEELSKSSLASPSLTGWRTTESSSSTSNTV